MLVKWRHLLPTALSHTLIYGVSIALMKCVSLLMLPIVAHYLRPEQFGQLELLTSIGIVCSILVGLGLEDTLFRYAGTETNITEQRRCAGNILTLTLLIGLVAGIAGWLISPLLTSWLSIPVSTIQLRITLLIIAFEGAISIPLAWLRMQQRPLLFFLATTSRTVLQAALIVLFLHWNLAVTGVLLACLLAAALQACVLTLMMIRETGIVFNLAANSRYFRYSLPIVGSGFVAFSLAGLDRWILADSGSLTQVAIYGVAAKFALATVLLFQPFGMWWSPQRFAVLERPDGRVQVAHYVMIGIAVVMCIALVVSIISPFLIYLLLPEAYHGAVKFVLWLVLAMAFKEISGLVNIGCFCGTSTKQQLKISAIAAAIGIVIMLAAAPVWGIWGIIIALNLAYVSKALLFFIASQRNLPLPYNHYKLALLIVMFSALVLFSAYVPTSFIGMAATLIILGSLAIVAVKLQLLSFVAKA